MAIHKGELIKWAKEKSGLDWEAFSKKIGRSKSNLYWVIKQEDINTSYLDQASHAIGINLYRYLIDDPEEVLTQIVSEKEGKYGKSYQDLQSELNEKQELINTLKENNAHLKEKLEQCQQNKGE